MQLFYELTKQNEGNWYLSAFCHISEVIQAAKHLYKSALPAGYVLPFTYQYH